MPSVILSCLLPLIIGPLYLILPVAVGTFLPAYTPGTTAARIVAVGIFFYGILGLTDYFLVTTGKLKQYALFGGTALVFNIVVDYSLIRMGYGIEGIAFGGTLLTYFFYSCIVMVDDVRSHAAVRRLDPVFLTALGPVSLHADLVGNRRIFCGLSDRICFRHGPVSRRRR